jgi:replicative DNA helicase
MNPYHDNQIERDLIAQLLMGVSTQYFRAIRHIAREEDFQDRQCGRAWAIMQKVADAGQVVDMVNFDTYAMQSGIPASELVGYHTIQGRCAQSDLAQIARCIRADAEKRRLLAALDKAKAVIGDKTTDLDEAVAQLRRAADSVELDTDLGFVTLAETTQRLLARLQTIMAGTQEPGAMTGFNYIDNRGGLKRGNLDIIAGRTSNGKTALALAMALNCALAGTSVAFYSFEMTLDEITDRLAAMTSGVPAANIARGPLDDSQLSKLLEAAGTMHNLPVLFDKTRSADLDKLMASITEMASLTEMTEQGAVDRGVRVVFVDYLQQLTGKGYRDKRALLSDACVKLKNLAVQLDITIVALSQLARVDQQGSRNGKPGSYNMPLMSQLKESGEIENSADNVYMIYRPELYGSQERFPSPFADVDTSGRGLVINSKSRSEAIGSFLVGFRPECTLYYDMDRVQLGAVNRDLDFSPRPDLLRDF